MKRARLKILLTSGSTRPFSLEIRTVATSSRWPREPFTTAGRSYRAMTERRTISQLARKGGAARAQGATHQMARLQIVDPAQATGETKELFDSVTASMGAIPNMTKA